MKIKRLWEYEDDFLVFLVDFFDFFHDRINFWVELDKTDEWLGLFQIGDRYPIRPVA